ncbi:SURF1 family protein [soil metagenome]
MAPCPGVGAPVASGSVTARYHFALRPRWLLSHLVVALAVALMVALGVWQLRRLDDRRDLNASIRSRQAVAVEDVAGIVSPEAGPDQADAVVYRRATASGTYNHDSEILVRNRTLDGRPGAWVLTPLVASDGTAVVVNRGWIPTQGVPDGVPFEARAPTGRVEVHGLLLASQERGSFGPTDPAEGVLDTLARADLGRLEQQVPFDLYPVYLQLESADPAPAPIPELLPGPELSEGPHLGYAAQWFIFSLIAAVGYPLILRRTAQSGGGAGGSSRPPDGDGEAVEPVAVAS